MRERQKNPCPTALPLGYGRGSSFLSSIPFCRNWNIQQRTDLIVQNQRPSVSTMSSWKLQQSSERTRLREASKARNWLSAHRSRTALRALPEGHKAARSEERRVGKVCVSTGRSRGSPYQ